MRNASRKCCSKALEDSSRSQTDDLSTKTSKYVKWKREILASGLSEEAWSSWSDFWTSPGPHPPMF